MGIIKINYIIKKGLQYFPPCLATILYLNDLNIKLKVFHGKNSTYINELFDKRNIEHYTLSSDKESKSKIDSIKTFVNYKKEMQKILLNIDDSEYIWFGNVESIFFLNNKIERKKIILSVLELYDPNTIYDKVLKKVLPKTLIITCCEKHRAAIMKCWYNLNSMPYVLENKPYEKFDIIEENVDYRNSYNIDKNAFIIIYQGIIREDRPLDKIATSLKMLNNKNILFLVLGKYDSQYAKKLKSIYQRTYFLGFIPSPEHLKLTSISNVGIANYDDSSLNNVFCAPNKIYEYSKYNLPILASNNVSLRESILKYKVGECVDFNDVNQIKEGLEKIINNYNYYKENSGKLYNSIDNFRVIQRIIFELNNYEYNKNKKY